MVQIQTVSNKMLNQICMFETGKRFGSKLTSSELNGIYCPGDSAKVGKHKTYGYGLLYYPDGRHFMDQVKKSYTQQEIETLYKITISNKVNKVMSQVGSNLSQDQLDALTCLAFNFGSVPASIVSLVKSNPNNPQIYNTWVHLSDAQYRKMGNRVKGLLTRRKLEADWYIGKHI